MLMHEIRLKRVYEVPSPDDGVRVLVDRLWPRGIRKADLPYDAWPKEITPSPELRKLYHRGEMPFAGFREGYAEELEASEGAADIRCTHRRLRPLPSAAASGSRRRM